MSYDQIRDCQDAITEVCNEIFAQRIAKREAATEQVHSGPSQSQEIDLSDVELLDKARSGKRGAEFVALYDLGDIRGYPSHSEADAALVMRLAFWCGRDHARIDRLFRSSRLMRSKWNRADYRERTIDSAIANCKEVFTPKPRTAAQTPVVWLEEA